MADIKLSEAIADLLAEQGVRHVFGIIGFDVATLD